MTAPTDAELDAYEALCNATTPGPWWVEKLCIVAGHDGESDEQNIAAVFKRGPMEMLSARVDTEFIAAARTGWPATIAALREARGALATTRERINAILRAALSGSDKAYRTEDGYVRWLIVERDLCAAIDTAMAPAPDAEKCAECGYEGGYHAAGTGAAPACSRHPLFATPDAGSAP
jgi:hypothetical protein